MHTTEPIQEYVERLKQASIQAMDASQFTRAVDLANAARLLSEWLEQGMPGDMPVDVGALLGEEKPALGLQEAIEQARHVEKERPQDLLACRESWEKVLGLDANHREALDALKRIGQEERLENLRKQIELLKEPLRAARKDLKKVDEARLEAHELLHGEPIPDPELKRELAEVHEQLDALREEVLRTTEGAVGYERMGGFEKAIRVYSEALKKGYDVIADEATGEYIYITEALRRARQAYWEDLQERAKRRLGEALKALDEGYPETAVERLEEANELTRKVEEGGEALPSEIEQALSKAKEALRNRQKAQQLVAEAEQIPNPEEALSKLHQARQLYPRYPGLETMIAKKETLTPRAPAPLTEALERAQRVEMEQPGNLVARREAWEKALALDPNHREALDALKRIEQGERLENLRKQIELLKEPLRAARKDLKKVEDARLKAHELLYGEPIPDPELKRGLAEVHEQLDALRNEILRASEGGASNERAENFEEAIRVYSEALKKGYDVIADDVTGEPVDVRKTLRSTRLAYWQDLQGRAKWRRDEALKALDEGYPETSVGRLEEAQELMKKVEEGGEDLRREIDQALSKAKEALGNWQKAQGLVTEAERMLSLMSPHEALGELYEARQIFPSYPDLSGSIAKIERIAANQAAREIVTDLSHAHGAMAAHDFGKAREYCQKASGRGAGLSVEVETDELRKRREETTALLKEVDTAEARWKSLEQIEEALDKGDIDKAEQLILQVLDKKPEEESTPEVRRYHRQLALLKIDQALEAKDKRLAKRLLDQLSEEEKRTPGVGERRTRLALLQEDDKKYAEAEYLFFEEGDYEHTIELCKVLKDSPGFKKQALALQRRAEARLWLGQGYEAYGGGDLKAAQKRFRAVEQLRSQLPEEDQSLVQEAAAERERIEREQEQAKELHETLKKAESLRDKPKVPWEEWYRTIKDLRKKAPGWLRAKVEEEYQEGVREWEEMALEEAQRLVIRKEMAKAYEILNPLADAELLPSDEPLWSEVEYKHHLTEAQNLLASKEWEMAEEMARKAMYVAPRAQLEEAQETSWEIVCQAISRHADFLAATTNPGPEGAVQLIEDKMKQYPKQLNMEPQLRSRLIRYCLDLGNYTKALEQARTIGYVPGEEKAAVFWEQVVQAAQGFAAGRWEQAVNILVDVQRQAFRDDGVSPRLKDVHDYTVQQVLTQLRQQVGPALPAISDEELITRIQALDLILRLDPKNAAAQEESQRLANRLAGLIPPLRNQAEEIELGDSLQSSLEEGERLLARVQSIIRTWEVTGGADNEIAPLRRAKENLQELVKPWREAWTALQQLREQWSHSVSGTWDIGELTKRLEEAQMALRGGEVKEITFWDGRIRGLKEAVGWLEGLIGQAEQEWREESFEKFIGIMDEMQEKVSEALNKLDEERFVIPEKKLSFYDQYAQARVAGIRALRERAQEKLDNLERWGAWERDFKADFEQAAEVWKQIEDWTQSIPPCLSRPLQETGPLEQMLEALSEKVNACPQEVLSDKARPIAEGLPSERLLQRLSDWLDQVQQKRQRLEEQIKAVEEPLQNIEKFRKSKRRLALKRNRDALRQFLEELRAVDSCHPELGKYEALLERFEK